MGEIGKKQRRRSWWGWGWDDQGLDDEQTNKLAASLSKRFDRPMEVRPAPSLGSLELREPRIRAPESIPGVFATDPHNRAGHSLGKAYRDVVRASYGQITNPPDAVAFPRDEADVVDVLDWATEQEVAVVPYGGGSSVCGGVEYRGEGDHRGWVSMDLTRLDQVLEIDKVSRAARIQGGALGPVLEDQLKKSGYTLRHFPQSFEFSTLGGWLATRSGGHYATVYTHIDDLVESMRVVTPSGTTESRRLPGSGAGPSPDRLFLGSEGSLGVITEAWMRVQERPVFKGSAGVRFRKYRQAVKATRLLSQSGLFPTNCRLLDAAEAANSAGVKDGSSLLVIGFESADHPVDAWIERALMVCGGLGGQAPDGVQMSSKVEKDGKGLLSAGRQGAVGEWRNSFLRAPYTRDALIRMGVIVETFETACTWDKFDDLHAEINETAMRAVNEICGSGWITCRFTHVYPDGPAPYFSIFAPGRPGSEVAMWDEVKEAVSAALGRAGGTITHHHAVGRDHAPWYERQRGAIVGDALEAVKRELDPSGILNPGVIGLGR